MSSNGKLSISIVIPTFCREQVLLDTIRMLLAQQPPAAEILIVDQTLIHARSTTEQLEKWDQQALIRWIRLSEPSIPKSMNHGLKIATQPLVLFLDDDITVAADLIEKHAAEYESYPEAAAVVGQVLQPGETSRSVTYSSCRGGLRADLEFPFYSSRPDWIRNVMAGNLSVKREFALRIGGFDENFVGVAYRFETEFARRLIANGGQIRYCPEASINHLRVSRGGTRSEGSHLTSADPRHGVGDYYFAICAEASWLQRWAYILRRPLREVTTRFHLKHPWYIPVKLVGEFRAFWAAVSHWRSGPRLLKRDEDFVALEERRIPHPNELSQRGCE